ncbi:GntR family transcriptional regulator [Romboutsia sp. 1001713B170207_170306_H8]|uniref:GntR family transcriptional regulator n=1 Tax=Romboutsia sp. 1001713B170207_170306_H8 TaxID=2787112 RepID=UPI0008212FA6|nr:GntR family transcriptional regulator [Romboutsia sp. 1001713B170207_170306_H8]SCH30623.1 DNA-binding transcriptional repressor MngR [uncultured Clostridium sp.]
MKIIISNSSDTTIYGQIVNQIKEAIISNELKSGYLLPSIRALAKDLNISVITTKRAYEELQKQGFIDIVPGKGTFVAGFSKDIIYEEKMKEIELKIEEIIEISKIIDVSREDIIEIFNCIYEG